MRFVIGRSPNSMSQLYCLHSNFEIVMGTMRNTCALLLVACRIATQNSGGVEKRVHCISFKFWNYGFCYYTMLKRPIITGTVQWSFGQILLTMHGQGICEGIHRWSKKLKTHLFPVMDFLRNCGLICEYQWYYYIIIIFLYYIGWLVIMKVSAARQQPFRISTHRCSAIASVQCETQVLCWWSLAE